MLPRLYSVCLLAVLLLAVQPAAGGQAGTAESEHATTQPLRKRSQPAEFSAVRSGSSAAVNAPSEGFAAAQAELPAGSQAVPAPVLAAGLGPGAQHRGLAVNTTQTEDDDAPFAKASTPEVRMAGQLGGAVFLVCTIVLIVYWVRQNRQEKSKAIAEGR